WAAAVALAADAFGKLDVLVNNAGVLTFARIADMPLAAFRRVLEVNAVGCWLGMKAVIGPMKTAGGGSIINISSIEGFTGAAGLSAYSASKFAIRGMTKSAAQELGEFGIRVNSVHPGGVLTSMTLGQAAAADPAGGGQAVAVPADIGEWATGQQLVAAALDHYGRLDILVNNAGVLRDRMVFTMSADEWDLVLRVHLRGHFVTTRFATAHWREQSK